VRAFTLRKLHSLSGVVPVGAFLVLHLLSQSRAVSGRVAYDEAFAWGDGLPLQPFLELVVVVLPLVFHAGYGVVLAVRSRPTVMGVPTSRSWMHAAQRLTGIVSLLWIVWHAGETWVPRLAGRISTRQVYPTLMTDLSTTVEGLPVTALLYLVGIGAASFHLANGLWGAGTSWGLLLTRRAQAIAGVAAVALGLALFALGTRTVVFFSTGSVMLGDPPSAEPAPLGSCAEPESPAPAAPRRSSP
jgi:succinate dehydrogenase/fumarate reductase cytochrome b subunit (b558 family)